VVACLHTIGRFAPPPQDPASLALVLVAFAMALLP